MFVQQQRRLADQRFVKKKIHEYTVMGFIM